ncbi:MAG: 3'(2'),5'-bisphosphate nucleotidase [Chloroflexi bacterium]|nr:3'(2'),5'-bisphosphate nucleotidase [Chloroflexota bacterium]
MINLNSPEVKFALEAARAAGLLVREIQSRLAGSSLTKDDRSPVTVADFAAQALVAHRLSQAFPDDPLVGEEESSLLTREAGQGLLSTVAEFVRTALPQAGVDDVARWIDLGRAEPASRFWTLDPIDGTKGFLRGEQYAVALALLQDGQVTVGTLACPNLEDGWREVIGGQGSLLVAVRGQGTWCASLAAPGELVRLSVSEIEDPVQARLLRSFEAGHTNVSQLDILAENMGARAQPLRLDSQAKYAILAAGHGDLLFRLISPKQPDYREKIWDQAAGAIICEEAGGRITDLDGKALDFTRGRTLAANRGVLASNARLHAAALAALRSQGI